MSYNLTPLAVCEQLFGSRAKFEQAIGAKPKAAYSWARPAQLRKAGDLPPYVQRKALEAVGKMGLTVDARWLIEGATRAEIDEAVVAARRVRRDLKASA